MPWSEKQIKLFRAAAHNPQIAKKTGIKQKDAEKMSKEGIKKYATGGMLGKAEDAIKSRSKAMAAADSDSGPTTDLPPESPPDMPTVETKRNSFSRAVGDRVRRAIGLKDTYKQGGPVKKFAGGGEAAQGNVRKSDRYFGDELSSKERGRIRDEALGQRKKALSELMDSKDPEDQVRPRSSDQKADVKRRMRNYEAASDNADDLPGRFTTGNKPYQYKKGGKVKSSKKTYYASAGGQVGGCRGYGLATKGRGKGTMR